MIVSGHQIDLFTKILQSVFWSYTAIQIWNDMRVKKRMTEFVICFDWIITITLTIMLERAQSDAIYCINISAKNVSLWVWQCSFRMQKHIIFTIKCLWKHKQRCWVRSSEAYICLYK